MIPAQQLLTRHHGRELTDHEAAASMLSEFPQQLWSQGPGDIGHCLTTEPVVLEVEPGTHVYVPQRPFRTEAQALGVDTALEHLWNAGVLELSDSSWNTPLNPVPKPDGAFRMAHDLRRVNEVTTTQLLPVPDPHKCLSVLTPEMSFFSVIDLTQAFFCIPLAKESRYQFAFTHRGVRLQYKVLPQGHKNAPGIFKAALKKCLSSLDVPEGGVSVVVKPPLKGEGTSPKRSRLHSPLFLRGIGFVILLLCVTIIAFILLLL